MLNSHTNSIEILFHSSYLPQDVHFYIFRTFEHPKKMLTHRKIVECFLGILFLDNNWLFAAKLQKWGAMASILSGS